jgi:hypothetical protein
LGKVSVDLSVVPGAIPKAALAQGSAPASDAPAAASTATTPFRQLSPEEEEAKSKEDKLELDLAVRGKLVFALSQHEKRRGGREGGNAVSNMS